MNQFADNTLRTGQDFGRSVMVQTDRGHVRLFFATNRNQVYLLKSTAPVVDTVRWLPLDWLVGWNDMFFMFLISGLFVPLSIERKGVGHFLVDRTKRLGIPFIIAVTLLSPLAYYPSWLSSDAVSQGDFLRGFFTNDNWSGGPAWFLWVLLAFCGVVAVAYRLIPNLMEKMSLSVVSARSLVVIFLAVSLLTTVPLRLFFLPETWSRLWGPFVFQTWKLLFYFAWFLLGAALGGGANLERSLSRENLRRWQVNFCDGGNHRECWWKVALQGAAKPPPDLHVDMPVLTNDVIC